MERRRRYKGKKSSLDEPMDPEEFAEVNVEDLIADNLETSDKLKILEEQSLGAALEDFVSKEQRSALGETVVEILEKKTQQLIKRGKSKNGDDTSISIKTTAALKEILEKEADKRKGQGGCRKGRGGRRKGLPPRRRNALPPSRRRRTATIEDDDEYENENGGLGLSDDDSGEKPRGKATRKKAARSTSSGSKASSARSRKKKQPSNDEDDLSDDHMDVEPTTTAKKSRVARPARRTAATKAKYTFDDVSDESDFNPGSDDDSDDEVELVEEPPKKGRAKKTASKRSTGTASSSGRGASSSFTSARKTKSKSTASSRSKKRATSYDDDDDSEDDVIAIDDGADWGTAGTQSQSKKRTRR